MWLWLRSLRREEKFIKASGRRVTTRKTEPQKKIETTTKNRFSLLSEEEEETVLIGDSMVKNQCKHFGLKNKNKRKVRSYPGASTKKIQEEVGKLDNENNKKTTIIVQASGNDLFLRNSKVGQTEPQIEQLEKTVAAAKKKTDNAIVIGILPRLNVSHYALSKAIGINSRLEAICKRNRVQFINLWDQFYGNRKLYRRDGTHFSEEGMRKYGNQQNIELYNYMKSTRPSESKSTKISIPQVPTAQGNL